MEEIKLIWIARVFDNSLWLFENKPRPSGGRWRDIDGSLDKINGTALCKLDPTLYPEVTYINSPKQLIIK